MRARLHRILTPSASQTPAEAGCSQSRPFISNCSYNLDPDSHLVDGVFLARVVAWRKENKMPDVVPFLTYEDGIAALEWLAEVFGFMETARFTSSDGRLSHGEMSIGDGLIMLASPSPDYEGPRRHRDKCESVASWSALPWIIDGVLVYVEDVDEHYARAKAAGAVILSEPEDGPPARRYRVEDPEGHRWMFMARDQPAQR